MMMQCKIVARIKNLYWKYLRNRVDYARYLGVKVGNNCNISIREWPTEPYLISIGDNVDITQGVRIHTHGGGKFIRTIYPDYDAFGKVVIEDGAYIGSGSIILPGVTIGKGSLVAAGTIVTKSIPPHCVVGGNPVHFICSIDDYISRNLQFDVSTKGLSRKAKKIYLLTMNNDKFIKKPLLEV